MLYKERIQKLREKNNLNQKQLANIIGISSARYCYYENEAEIIPIEHLNTICNYFNVSIDYILNFTNSLNYDNNKKEINKIKAGEHLKSFRKENKLTQEKLAKILNTVHSVITKCEKGTNLLSTPFLYTICSKYYISADYLLGKIDNPKYLK